MTDDIKAIAQARAKGNASLCIDLGNKLYREGQTDRAIVFWQEAINIQPKDARGYSNIGVALKAKGQIDAAIAMYQKALSVAPNHINTYLNLANLWIDRRKFDDAKEVYQNLLAVMPNSPDAIAGLAKIYERKGKIQEAYALLSPLIASGTKHAGAIITFAVVCHRLNPIPTNAVAFLQRQLTGNDLAKSDRKQILLGLGNLYDALNRYEEAFRCFQQAKSLGSASTDATQSINNMAIVRNAYTAERLALLPRATPRSELPLFIVGMPRSGTTLAEQILSSHPQVFGAGELTHMGKIAVSSLGTELPYPQCLEIIDQAQINGLAASYLEYLRTLSATASRITDKMPLNFLHLGLIEMLCPQARVIHCVRHPLDTCLSCYFNDFSAAYPFTNDLTALGTYYRHYWELMQHWQTVLSIPIFTLRYEDLIANPEQTCHSLVSFCGLEWDKSCLKFHEQERFVDTPSYYQVRQPIYTQSVGRYKPYEPYLEPLKVSLGRSLD